MTRFTTLPLIGCSDEKHLNPLNRSLVPNLKLKASSNNYNQDFTTCCAKLVLHICSISLFFMRSACMMCEINIVRRAQANRSNLLVKQDNALIC